LSVSTRKTKEAFSKDHLMMKGALHVQLVGVLDWKFGAQQEQWSASCQLCLASWVAGRVLLPFCVIMLRRKAVHPTQKKLTDLQRQVLVFLLDPQALYMLLLLQKDMSSCSLQLLFAVFKLVNFLLSIRFFLTRRINS
jgi:uncharacterized protein (DUF2236 family)